MELILKDKTYAIRGAAFEVYKEMGNGFLEAVYQECMEKELMTQGIPFISQPKLTLFYKDKELKQHYKPDLICYDEIIIELKAVKEIGKEHKAQIINYLKATNLKLGLLINFGAKSKVEIERFIL